MFGKSDAYVKIKLIDSRGNTLEKVQPHLY